MFFGGIQKNSFIDYPGKVSCVLFLSGCNFSCPFCHNPDLAKGYHEYHENMAEEGIYNFLKIRREFLDGVVISGGEPTLQKDLFQLCERIKNLGYSVKLDTNGSRPHEVRNLINEGLVDYVAMDIKTDPIYYNPTIKKGANGQDIITSIQIIMESAKAYEFRTTCVKPLINEKVIEGIARIIKGASLYALQEFQKTEVLNPECFQEPDSWYTEDEIMDFKTIVEPWVQECVVR
ncbi:MAG: anaerobic ribonucleoside-triphosphate reductase activating protein [Deltaproteobacteria bacterium]|nr:anaerobic ribonucleoside-triphosphate reductase activating protein [Deltaproteobacteria bacterium]MBW1913995.1 anaerobic ribonucleoside-triphosphate reductase activating protein [Deltaproteobacteria bacterium]